MFLTSSIIRVCEGVVLAPVGAAGDSGTATGCQILLQELLNIQLDLTGRGGVFYVLGKR